MQNDFEIHVRFSTFLVPCSFEDPSMQSLSLWVCTSVKWEREAVRLIAGSTKSALNARWVPCVINTLCTGIKIVFDNFFLGLAGSPKEKKVLVAEQVKY